MSGLHLVCPVLKLSAELCNKTMTGVVSCILNPWCRHPPLRLKSNKSPEPHKTHLLLHRSVIQTINDLHVIKNKWQTLISWLSSFYFLTWDQSDMQCLWRLEDKLVSRTQAVLTRPHVCRLFVKNVTIKLCSNKIKGWLSFKYSNHHAALSF